ncbi:Asp-tRNAAsn/Glu-tRNAGln amidotransferase A subunit [Cnuella takakiae]|uniref:Asp-tRNAAsn/Glu-tRNAGln amidotransferase A subunit n=1 Tax=Cnuella takakiae TaxID=1302690 RepID=A0A1M5DXP0_9BACT|nr:amidase family protein [Cnuella takakiae]OLY93838.1 amidase [Cnuella takakiae]SHF71601.1 Asp-tRNAAsn/Glu-tRNAGln amidotransferase A subunit [Cnuella takakiae]
MKNRIQAFLWPILLLLLGGCAPKVQQAVTANAPAFDPVEITIAGAQEALRTGKCSCEQLVGAYLERIRVYDQPTKLNAIVVANPEALAIARRLDAEWRRTGLMRPLHCIPVIVKDNVNTAGLQTAAGSLALKGYVPDSDATLVQRLKDAGAIVLAKSNMAEWAFSPMVSISSLAGETLNPYNLLYVPAGSSGGTAAAIAASLGLVGIGTDTGNSIRGPSSHNALVGFRTTLGLVSRAGVAPLYLRNDVAGPMTRTVEDATRMLDVLKGYDPQDTLTRYSRGRLPETYTAYLQKDALKGARIGVLRTLSERNPDPQIKALFEQAIADLRRLGAVVVDSVVVPNFDSLSSNQWCSVFAQDINTYLGSLTPAPPVKTVADILASGKYAPYIKDNLQYHLEHADTVAADVCGDAYSDRRRIAFRNAVVQAMDRYSVGALIYPTWNNPPAHVGAFEEYKGDNSQVIAPHTGQPAFTVPMGFSRDNLPAGLQFLGRPFDEPTLIRLTYSYEQGTLHRKPPALFPALRK